MKFNFKIQQYQTDAVDAVVKVFNGQGFYDKISYIRDLGKMKSKDMQMTLGFTDEEMQLYDPTNDTGYKNELVELSDEQLLSNIQALQRQNNIKLSNSLVKDMGRCSLDIEMETGTDKTYVYIKTMFELNKKYGWSKFIVVVPSIAIREGVKKSFEITADHFMEHYGKKARFFIYNSSNLNQLDNFSSSSGINVMIINTQAFASSLKEDGRSKEARIIYSKRDEFGSRRPIDVIKANRPIIILDEPSVGLDPKQIIEIRELIRQLAKKHTVILSSHILAEVREVCDYILIISKGKLVASDTPENLERNLGDSDLIEIETKASPDEVRRILETVDGIRSISTKHLENGITWAQVQEKKNTDIREKVFQAFAQNHQPLLKLNPLQVSLEDVFMELTQSDRAAEEYAEKAKKKETEDMKDAGDL